MFYDHFSTVVKKPGFNENVFLAGTVCRNTIYELPSWIQRGIIAIDGYSGSGKTTLATELCAVYQQRHFSTNLIHCDWFATWENPVGWWQDMYNAVLTPLLRGKSVWFHTVDWRGGAPDSTVKQYLEPSSIIIIEGFSAVRKSLQELITYSIWVDGGSPDSCLERAVARDGENHRAALTQWKEFESGWFAVDRTWERCHKVHVEHDK